MTARHPVQRPGTRFVIDALGTDPEQLSLSHTQDDPHALVARAVAKTAGDVDSFHQSLMRRAAEAIRALQPVARGDDPDLPLTSGVLGTSAQDIDLLAARRGAAHQELVRLVTVYQQLSPAPASAAIPASLDRGPVRKGEAVSRGGLRWKQSPSPETAGHLSDGTGFLPPLQAAAVEQLITGGLLTVDTTTTPAQGRPLTLTRSGLNALLAADGTATVDRAALTDSTRTARSSDADADPRATAARSRSTRSPRSTRPADAPTPTAGTAAPDKPDRTR
jgi:hypothetical protein